MKRYCSTASLTILAFGLIILPAGGAGILNGDFESPALSGLGGTFAQNTVPAGFSWTLASGSIEVLTSAYWQPASGSQSLDLSGAGAGSIFQDFTFATAGSWLIRFDMSANPDLFSRGDGLGSGLKRMQVDFGVAGMMSSLGTYGLESDSRTIHAMDWTSFAVPVTVLDSQTYRLQFTSLAFGAGGPALDNVRLEMVPEPCAVVFAGLGAMTLFFLARRRT